MNNYDELFTDFLHQYENGIKSFDELLSDLKILSGGNLVENLNNYFERKIESIINSHLLNEAEKLDDWQLLENIQVIICKFIYRENLKLSKILEDFVHDFDRIDDPQMRAYILERLKKNELSYA